MNREELIKRAKELGLKFDEDKITETELQKIINEAEKNVKEDDTLTLEELNEKYKYSKSELEKAIKKRDAVKAEKRQALAEIEELKKKLADSPKSDEFSQLKAQLEELQEEKRQRDKELEEKELAKKTEHEREMYRMKKQMEELQKELDNRQAMQDAISAEKEKLEKQTKEQIKALRKKSLEAEIISIASNKDAFNPKQIARMIKDDFEYDDVSERYVFTERNSKGNITKEQDVDEYVTDFLSKEENENLIRSKINTSSLHINKTSTKSSSSNDDLGGFDPKDPKLIEEASEQDMTPERYIKVVLLPQQKLKNKE